MDILKHNPIRGPRVNSEMRKVSADGNKKKRQEGTC